MPQKVGAILFEPRFERLLVTFEIAKWVLFADHKTTARSSDRTKPLHEHGSQFTSMYIGKVPIWVFALENCESISIAVVDDQALFLDGLAVLLSTLDPRFSVQKFGSGTAFLNANDEGFTPDILLCDMTMAPLNGLELIDQLLVKDFQKPIIVISAVEDRTLRESAIRHGASAFLGKSTDADTLHIMLVELLSQNMRPFRKKKRAIAHSDFRLTTRQRAILRLIADGCSNTEAALSLGISENTVKTHMKTIFRIFGVSKRSECIQRALDLALI